MSLHEAVHFCVMERVKECKWKWTELFIPMFLVSSLHISSHPWLVIDHMFPSCVHVFEWLRFFFFFSFECAATLWSNTKALTWDTHACVSQLCTQRRVCWRSLELGLVSTPNKAGFMTWTLHFLQYTSTLSGSLDSRHAWVYLTFFFKWCN